MILSECGRRGAKILLLFLSLFFLLLGANQKNRCGNSHKLYCVNLHVCILSFMVFCDKSVFFFHHLILKLERKGIEGWIANIRGFWKFPFYGTWVFHKNSSLSVVFLWFWWKSLCPAVPLLYLSVIPTLFRAWAWMEMVRGRITWFALPGRKEPHLDPF